MEKAQLIYGIRALMEAVKAGTTFDKIFIQKDLNSDLMRQLLQLLRQQGIGFQYVPVEKLNRFTALNHQGAVATIAPIDFVDLDTLIEQALDKPTPPLFLLLDQLSDARNVGAIIRTAACTGVSGIIMPQQGAAPINGDMVKTSAGALFQVPICKVAHSKDALYALQASGIQIVAATEKTDTLLYDIPFSVPTALIMGNEEKGIHPTLLKMADHRAALPMQGGIASLNVSVACGAFLYEIVRQRRG